MSRWSSRSFTPWRQTAGSNKDCQGRCLSTILLQETQHSDGRLHEALTQRRSIEMPLLADRYLLPAEFPLELRDTGQGVVVALGGAMCDAAEVEPRRTS